MSETSVSGGKGKIFISYADEDAQLATVLCLHLETDGLPCWMAPRDSPPGLTWAEAILEGLDESSIFLLIFSQHANESTHVQNEVQEAANKSKPIFLVRTDETDPLKNTKIRLFLGSRTFFDASTTQFTSHADHIVSDVKHLLTSLDQAISFTDRRPDPSQVGRVSRSVEGAASPRLPQGPRSIGIEVGATKVRGCAVELANPAFAGPALMELPVRPRNIRAVLAVVNSMVDKLVSDSFHDDMPVGVGVAVPGQVDPRAGTLKFGPNLYGARNVPFKTSLSRAFPGLPVRVDNEVRCATRAELHLGFGKDFDSFVCIFIGTGVGSGTVVGRRLVFGHDFCAGEIGHMKVAPIGPPCACGQIGCLETFVKSQAIIDLAQAKAIDWESRGLSTSLGTISDSASPQRVAEAIDAGDEAAREVASEIGKSLGLGVANYLNVVNPAAVVIGGGVMTGFFVHMIDAISDAVQKNALAEVANTPIVHSAHTDDGIATGAALMFHENDEWPFH